MPRVLFHTSVAGRGFQVAAGEEVDLSPDEAKKWCDGVRAELVRKRQPETPERSARKRGSKPETTS